MIPPALQNLPRDIRFLTRFGRIIFETTKLQRKAWNVGQIFDKVAKDNSDKPCFYYDDEVWTYKRVQDTTNQIGNYFSEHGLKKGNVVSVFMGNRIEVVLTWLGLSKIGVVPAMVNFNLTSTSLKHSIECVNPNAIICGYEVSKALSAIYPEGRTAAPVFGSGVGDRKILSGAIDVDRDLHKVSAQTPQPSSPVTFGDDLFYIYTSGTTGLPKAAIIKHSRFLMIGYGLRRLLDMRPTDLLYTPFPLQHTAGGIIAVGFPLLHAIPLVIKRKFTASEFWDDCIKYKVTAAQYMGETCRYLMKQPISPSEKSHNLRMVFGNGLRPEIWDQFKERFNIPLVSEMYGATEGNCNIFNIFGKHGAVGFVPPLLQKFYPVTIVKLDENDEPVRDLKTGLVVKTGVDEQGELVGKIVDGVPIREFKGYAGNEKESLKKVMRDVNKKGDKFFRTGDAFTRDAHGYYYFKDRMGDSFRWKSENVSTTQVENVLSSITKLKDVVVYGVQIPGTEGSAGMAAIADPDNQLNLDTIVEEMVQSLPKYAIPLFFRKVSHIEFTVTHKAKKVDLRKEGYDLKKTGKDKIYFFNEGKFTPLTEELVERINSGQIKL